MKKVKIGSCLLIHGDSFTEIKKLKPIDAVITDPPYNYDALGLAIL